MKISLNIQFKQKRILLSLTAHSTLALCFALDPTHNCIGVVTALLHRGSDSTILIG